MDGSGMRRHAAWCAGAVWLAALLAFGAMLDGYSHARHPVALLGARGIAHALEFNVVGLLLPGLLAAWSAHALRRRLPVEAGWSARIGAWLLLLSALGFAAQGLVPLDPADLDSPGSRLHAAAWMLWWLAFVPAALLLAVAALGKHGGSQFVLGSVVAAVLVLLFAVLAPIAAWAGVAQRIAFCTWFAWLGLAGRWPTAR